MRIEYRFNPTARFMYNPFFVNRVRPIQEKKEQKSFAEQLRERKKERDGFAKTLRESI